MDLLTGIIRHADTFLQNKLKLTTDFPLPRTAPSPSCNTDADDDQNWASRRGIATLVGGAGATGSVLFTMQDRPFRPVDVRFREGRYAFGSMMFEDGLSLTLDAGARLSVDTAATGPTARFVAGQTYRQQCDLACHKNWEGYSNFAGLEGLLFNLTEVPCANDVATFGPDNHYTLDAAGTHLYAGVEFGGGRLRGLENIPADQAINTGPDRTQTYFGMDARSKCGELSGRGDCVCLSSCRDIDDPTGLQQAARYREQARSRANRALTLLVRQAGAASTTASPTTTTSATPTAPVGSGAESGAGSESGSGVASSTTDPDLVIPTGLPQSSHTFRLDGAGVPEVDLVLLSNLDNAARLQDRLLNVVVPLFPECRDLVITAVGISNPYASYDRPIGSTGLPIAWLSINMSVSSTAPAWDRAEQIEIVMNVIVATQSISGMARCGVPQGNLANGPSEQCVDSALVARAHVLRTALAQTGLSDNEARVNMTAELTATYREVRGCGVLEVATGICGSGDAAGRAAFYSAGGPPGMDDKITQVAYDYGVATSTPPPPTENDPRSDVGANDSSESGDIAFIVGSILGVLVLLGLVVGFVSLVRDERRGNGPVRPGGSWDNPLYLSKEGAKRVAQLVAVDVDSDDETDAPTYGDFPYAGNIGGPQNTDAELYGGLDADFNPNPREESLYAVADEVSARAEAGKQLPEYSTADPGVFLSTRSVEEHDAGSDNMGSGDSMHPLGTDADTGLSGVQHSNKVYQQAAVRFDGNDADYDYVTSPSDVNGGPGQHGEVYLVPVRLDGNRADFDHGTSPSHAEGSYDYGIIEQHESDVAPASASSEKMGKTFTESTQVMGRTGSHYGGFAEDGKSETTAPAKTFRVSAKVLGRKGSVYDGFADDSANDSADDPDDGYLKVVGAADSGQIDDGGVISEDDEI